ncbi:MAG: hypothetical protein R3B07_16380 [Polyangiaceae bacterium]
MLPLKAGVAVMNDQKPELWTASGLEGRASLTVLVAAKGSAVACVGELRQWCSSPPDLEAAHEPCRGTKKRPSQTLGGRFLHF